jgi:hypothetical protein
VNTLQTLLCQLRLHPEEDTLANATLDLWDEQEPGREVEHVRQVSEVRALGKLGHQVAQAAEVLRIGSPYRPYLRELIEDKLSVMLSRKAAVLLVEGDSAPAMIAGQFPARKGRGRILCACVGTQWVLDAALVLAALPPDTWPGATPARRKRAPR